MLGTICVFYHLVFLVDKKTKFAQVRSFTCIIKILMSPGFSRHCARHWGEHAERDALGLCLYGACNPIRRTEKV